ncbi:hypothetical protein DMH25_01790 [Streptomyces sp. WAC 01325]|uniref:hypothetical protein n=1 Tax=Streptomyces sp. WAC 01325 TaxID=2203202 RepID=UPI000F893562|nr:hypothetical protein [Streptomyces sp. WAC 01325]RSN18348.1 hypothetical protein DMH25_01790 [Streptomyces sp. WAC 01325]
MTHTGNGEHDTDGVLVRARSGDVNAEVLAYAQDRIRALANHPGMPALTGEVRIDRAVAHRAEQPWSAVAEVRAGHRVVIVHAREATGRELADRLQDRLREQLEQAVRGGTDHRAIAPPWRGGGTAGRP